MYYAKPLLAVVGAISAIVLGASCGSGESCTDGFDTQPFEMALGLD